MLLYLDPNIGLFLGSDTITGDMKKILFLLLLVLGWQEVVGQKHPPILPYKEKDYTTEEARAFASSGKPLGISWRDSVIFVVRMGIFEAMEKTRDPRQMISLNQALLDVDRGGIEYILENTLSEYVEIEGRFENSYQDKELVVFYPDKDFKGMAHVFKVSDFLSIVIFKSQCLNVTKAGILLSEPVPPTSTPPPPPTPTSASSSIVLAERLVQQDAGRYDRSPYATTPKPKSLAKKSWVKPFVITTVVVVGIGLVVCTVVYLCSPRGGVVDGYEDRTQPEGISRGVPIFAF